MKKREQLLYLFQKLLSRAFKSREELFTAALPFIQDTLKLDRIYFFDWEEETSLLSLSIMCKDGECMDTEEKISLHNKPDFIKDLIVHSAVASEDLSYPALYVLIRWQTPSVYTREGEGSAVLKDRFGVLRLERFNKKKNFSAKEIDFILELAQELSASMVNTEIVHDNNERLRVASGLNELTTIFAQSLRFDDGIEIILQGVQKYFRFDRARLYLFDYKGENVTGMLSSDVSGKIVHSAERISSEELKDVLETDIFHSDRAINLPLSVQGKRVGVLMLDNMLSRRKISQADYLHLKQFSSQIALAIDNAVLFDRVQDLYNYDELTKLPVRRYFMEKMNEELYRSKRFDLSMSVILMDIDWFKEINDTFGHKVGDYALIEVSNVIRNSLRQTDFPCRYGGDEILIMLPRTSAQESKYIAKRIGEKIKAISIPHELSAGKDFSLSVSQGIAIFPQDSRDAMDLINKADKALYAAKKRQRGTYALYRDIDKEEAAEQPDKYA